MKNKSGINKKGFTLIEVIAVVAIISIIGVVAVVSVNRLLKTSKEETENISLESVKKSAVAYANENYNNEGYWIKHEFEDLEYSCVPVLELVNKGYLKKEDIENYSNNWNFVKVNRYSSNKTIFSEENGNEFCSWGTAGNKSTTLVVKKVTTSSIEVQTTCDPSEGVLGYSFALKTNSYGDELRNNSYKFSNLISDNKYQIKSKCNYADGVDAGEAVSDYIEVGSTNVSFNLSDLKTDDSLSKLYKSVTIKFSSNNVTFPSYYFKTTSSDNVSNKTIMSCGNGTAPSNCTDYTGKLQRGYWYKLKEGNEVVIDVYGNSIIYAKVWDGERYSTNKSIQVTFPTNPYVVLNVSHNKFTTKSGQYMGEENEILDFYTDNWMSMPEISWKVYGGYDTTSTIYISNSGNEEEDYLNRRNAAIEYTTCKYNQCTFNNIRDNGGMQEIKIEVANNQKGKKTIILIHVNIDKKEPTMSISVSDGKTYSKSKSATITLNDTGGSGLANNSNKIYYAWSTTSVSCSSMTEYITITPNSGASSATGTITINSGTGAGKLYICNKDASIKDISENSITKSTVKSAKMYLDNTGPVVTFGTNGNTTAKKEQSTKVTVTDANNGTVSTLKYLWTETNGTSASNGTTFTNGATISTKSLNGTYYLCIYTTDSLGNSTNTCSNAFKFDNTAPSIEFGTNGNSSYAKSVSSTITVKNDSNGSDLDISSYYYTYSTSSSATPNTAFTSGKSYSKSSETGTYYLIAKACDKVGNCTTKTSNAFNLDNQEPSKPTIDNPTKEEWTNQNFSLTLSSSDSHSGIAYYQYTYSSSASATGSDSNSQWITYSNSASNSFTTTPFLAERNQYVYIRACDKVGNCSNKNSTMIKIDKSVKVAVTVKNSSVTKSVTCTSSSCTIDFNTGTWYNNAPTISWTITDTNTTNTYFYYNDANVYSSRSAYKTSNVISSYNGTTAKSGSYTINTGGKRQVAIAVKDSVGNQTIVKVNFDLDIIAPTCSYEKSHTWYSDGVTAQIGCSDDQSGCSSGAGTYYNLTSNKTYYVYDQAGNYSSCTVPIEGTYVYRYRTRSSWCKTCSSAGCASYSDWSLYNTYYGNFGVKGWVCDSDYACYYYAAGGTTDIAYYYTRTCNAYNSSCSTCGTGYGSWGSWSGYAAGNYCNSSTCQSESLYVYY